jgi:protein TonB
MHKKTVVRIGACLAVVAAIGLIFGMLWLKKNFADDTAPKKKMIQQITVVTPPPPPPPPPPKIQEPEKVEEQPIEEQIEEALPDQGEDAPAGEELGVDADGSAGSDGFGLRAKKGGRGLLGGGGYFVGVKQELNEYLVKHPKLKHMEYVAVVNIWIADSGEFERYEVSLKSGNPDAELLLTQALSAMKRVNKPRPLELKKHVSFRLSSVL